MKGKLKIDESGNLDAFVVIDGQNDFVKLDGALSVAGIEGELDIDTTIGNIIKLGMLPFGYLVTSEDNHLAGHIEFNIFPPHCVEKTFGQQYVSVLCDVYKKCDEHIIKGDNVDIIAYSIATSNEFANHISRLRSRGVKRVFVVGWAYTHCVGESAIAYVTQGFETFVVRDATRSVPPPYGDPESMKKKLELYGVKEIFMADIERG